MWKDPTKICQKESCLKEWELEKILEVRPCPFIKKLFPFYPDFPDFFKGSLYPTYLFYLLDILKPNT